MMPTKPVAIIVLVSLLIFPAAAQDLTVEEVAGVLETIDYGTRVCDYETRWGLMTAHTIDWADHFGISPIAMKDEMRAANADIRSLAAADLPSFCQMAKGLAIKLDMI